MKPLAKWKVEYLERVRAYSNAKLLTEAFALAGGDDYDGCFTERGGWLYGVMTYELDCRLWMVGWTDETPFHSGWGVREP